MVHRRLNDAATTHWQTLKRHYLHALDLGDDERRHYLSSLDAPLQREVKLLLEETAVDEFLAPPGFGNLSSAGLDTEPGAPRPIEKETSLPKLPRHRLLRPIGSGGMGNVYLAERLDGVFDQQVAVKVLKNEAVHAETLRRFENERQTLARLDHPNIARILDGGTLGDGRPYLVMEYVEGVPIDEYCDRHALTTRERLDLFSRVLSAIRYAHQQLVVHRDLKPGNILVTEAGEPKLLDFGIAKVLHEDTPDLTRERQCPYTLEYASPEQIRGEAISTSTDVYSLGVVLYRLLTGRNPYRLDTEWRREVERIICEEDPVRPSTALRQQEQEQSTERAKPLSRDLDAIVMMALRKEPQQRYRSVDQLDADIHRHMNNLPVLSRRGSFWYRANRFLKRRLYAVMILSALAVAAVGGVAALLWEADYIARERDKALVAQTRLERINEFLNHLLQSAAPTHDGAEVTVREVLDRASAEVATLASEDPRVASELLTTLGKAYHSLGRYEDSLENYRRALDLRERHEQDTPQHIAWSLNNVGTVYYTLGELDLAAQFFEQSLAQLARVFDSDHLDVAQTLNNLASVKRMQGDLDAAAELGDRALAIRRKHSVDEPLYLAESLNNVANLHRQRGDLESSEKLLRESLEIRSTYLSTGHPLYQQSLANLGTVLLQRRALEEAEPLFAEAIRLGEEHLGPDHPELSFPLHRMAQLKGMRDDFDSSIALYRRVIAIRRESYPDGHPLRVQAETELAQLLERADR